MQYEMYVGGSGEKSLARAVLTDGKIQILERMNAVNHAFLSLEGNVLYAVSEVKNGSVLSYAVSPDGSLAQTSCVPSQGDIPCHVSVAGRTLLVSNYASGSLARFALQPDGSIGAALPLIAPVGRGPKADRQEHAHIHFAQRTPGGWVAVSDLGSDAVSFIPFQEIENDVPQPIVIRTPAGYGPRHLAFPKKGDCWYALCELESELLIYSGSPTHARLVGRMPVGSLGKVNYPAALRLSPDETMLAATSRGEDVVTLYAITASGMLSQLCTAPSRGAYPRDAEFTPDGKYLVCANQRGSSLTVFEVSDGRLHFKSQTAHESPMCVAFRKG